MHLIPATGPLDDLGRLVHEDDAAAQLALALARIEDAVHESGHELADLRALRILTADRAVVEDVVDVVTERLTPLGVTASIDVVDVSGLEVHGMLVALEADLERDPCLLVVVAHPDDEAFGTGSVLAYAAAHGVSSVVVCATRGELGEPAPGSGLTRADLPATRERELREACSVLGARCVDVLGYLDSGMEGDPAKGSLAAADPTELRDRVATVIDQVRPDVVVTLDASDGHRDHAAMRDATLAALEVVAERPRATYLFCLARSLMTEFTGLDTLGTPDHEITTQVDVADLLDLRWQAIRTHASQVPPFDAMDQELQHGFLAIDRLLRVDPPWPGGPAESTWLPATRSSSGSTMRTHHPKEER